MTKLLEKDMPHDFNEDCMEVFNMLKNKLTNAPIMVGLDWNLPLKLMSDASNFVVGAVLGQPRDKHFKKFTTQATH